jgi:Holliday junction resolvasome RuvABC endonuclease subunit
VSEIKVLGFDPSLRNWGVAVGYVDSVTHSLRLEFVDVIQPVLPTGKQVRQNSKDIESAYQLAKGAASYLDGVGAIFAEVPVGSQSARAMASYGICVGVLGAIRTKLPIYEITPNEVKLSTVGKKTATKKEMIDYITSMYPDANWPRYKKNGVISISEAKAEHMADAVAAIIAGTQLQEFKQALALRAA